MTLNVGRDPRENLAAAEDLLRRLPEMMSRATASMTPGLVAELDQMVAAAAEVNMGVRRVAEEAGSAYRGLAVKRPATMAWALAVRMACDARLRSTCPHFDWMALDLVQLVALTEGLGGCWHCWGTLSRAELRAFHELGDDERCDVCDRETTFFMPFTCGLGAVMVTGHACSSCSSFFGDVAEPIP